MPRKEVIKERVIDNKPLSKPANFSLEMAKIADLENTTMNNYSATQPYSENDTIITINPAKPDRKEIVMVKTDVTGEVVFDSFGDIADNSKYYAPLRANHIYLDSADSAKFDGAENVAEALENVKSGDSITTVNLVPDGSPATKKTGLAPTKPKNYDFKFETYENTLKASHIHLSTKPSIYGSTLQIVASKIPDFLNGKLNACDVLPKGGGQPQTLAQNCEVLKLLYFVADKLTNSGTEFSEVTPHAEWQWDLTDYINDCLADTGVTETPNILTCDRVQITITSPTKGVADISIPKAEIPYTTINAYFTKGEKTDFITLTYDKVNKKIILTSSVTDSVIQQSDFNLVKLKIGE